VERDGHARHRHAGRFLDFEGVFPLSVGVVWWVTCS
jgi:hypothetical protein